MKKTIIDDNWKCKRSEYDEEKLDIHFGETDSGYRAVSIPHDSLIDDVSLFYKDHVIWYERDIEIGDELYAGRRFYLYFDGIYTDAAVYVNRECFEIDSLYVYTTQEEDRWKVHAFIKTGDFVGDSRKVFFTLDGPD